MDRAIFSGFLRICTPSAAFERDSFGPFLGTARASDAPCLFPIGDQIAIICGKQSRGVGQHVQAKALRTLALANSTGSSSPINAKAPESA